jgi:hypothetical protein
MAHRILYYNVDKSVGKFGVNEANDVLLVRFFLRRCMQVPSLNGPHPQLPLVTYFDLQLHDSIIWFQKAVREKGKKCALDGQVDRAPDSGELYTMTYLNATYGKHYPKYCGEIEDDPECPGPLKKLVRYFY